MSAQHIRKAMTVGRKQAADVMQEREKALKTRRKAVRAASAGVSESQAASTSIVAAAGGPGRTGVLVAEGDSWFDYPGTDVLGVLEDRYGYDVESVAHKGDRVEDMAYSEGQLAKFTRTLEPVR